MSIPVSAIRPAVNQVIGTMYFADPEYKGAGNPETPLVGATVRFAGAFQGQFRVVVNRELAARLTADFLVADLSEVSPEQTEAAMRELANVACGAALSTWMPQADFRFAVPAMLPSEEVYRSLSHCFAVDGDGINIGFDLSID